MNVFLAVPRDRETPPETPSRLTRAQFTQKVGARGHYPRLRGVLIPRPLLAICRQADLDGVGSMAPMLSSVEDRRELGRAVVHAVGKAFRHFPEEILALELPHPSVVLSSLAIEDRTRNAIDRLLPLIKGQPTWTVARYLEIPKFGARCLVDLMAAREESLMAGRS